MMNLCLKDKAEQALLEGSSMIKAQKAVFGEPAVVGVQG